MKKTLWLSILFLGWHQGLVPMKCNGKAEYCNRKYNDIVQIRVHNATSTTKDLLGGFLPNPVANQNRDLSEQLFQDGIRAFKLPIHKKGNENVAWVTHTLPPGDLAKYAKDFPILDLFKDSLYQIDASNQSLVNVLTIVKDFLNKNPHEVVTLFLDIKGDIQGLIYEDFVKTGLIPFMHKQNPDAPWPTFGQMIADNKRLVVFANKVMTQWSPLYNYGADFFFDNEYDYKTVQALKNDDCEIVSGLFNFYGRDTGPKNKLFDLSHDVTPGLAGDATMAREVNSYGVLRNHVDTCFKRNGIYPEFISLDFYDQNFGDVLKIIDEINQSKIQNQK